MANVDFYALGDDPRRLFDFLYSEMDVAGDSDWRALAKLSGRIQRHIRGRLAAAKLHARPVLHQALAMVQQGNGLWFGSAVHRADSANIQRIA
jgi:hypothetical protein